MDEIINKSNRQPGSGAKDGAHHIRTLVEEENLNVFTPGDETQASQGQIFMVDCRVSPPKQVREWYVSRPSDAPFLLLCPEKEHLAEMAGVCSLTVTEAQYGVLYETALDDRLCVTALGYTPPAKGKETDDRTEPAIGCEATKYFMDAVRRCLEGLIKLDITQPDDPPEGLIWSYPGQIRSSLAIVFQTDREPGENGYDKDQTARNKSATSVVSTYTPYLFLQQEDNGTNNSQILIVANEWNIIAGDLYADHDQDRGNAQCVMFGRLRPNPNSPFFASDPPNDFSPKSGSNSFDASIDEDIYYYDSSSGRTLSYQFSAAATYSIEDWAVSSNCSGTSLGPNFYATQPANCEDDPMDAFKGSNKIRDLSPASKSGGQLNFGTFSSWQTAPNQLVTGSVIIDSDWRIKAYRWYVDQGFWGNTDYYFVAEYPFSQDFYVDFTSIQPPY